jgi:hypothetical protein
MDEVSSRGEHCFAGQRTRFEGSKVVVQRIHDVVNEFLGQTHTTVMDRGENRIEVDGLLRYLGGHLNFPDERPSPPAKCSNYSTRLAFSEFYRARTTHKG